MEPFQPSCDYWNHLSPGDKHSSSLIIHHDDLTTTLESRSKIVLPRSAFMCFMAHKEKSDATKQEIAFPYDEKSSIRIVASEWDKLSSYEKAQWEEVSRNDRIRYLREKTEYGPSLEPKSRAKKHPLAPKKPMSSFLRFSLDHRSEIKTQNPTLLNSDISRILGEMWRNTPQEIKARYIEEQDKEREIYRRDITAFNQRLKYEEEQECARFSVGAKKVQSEEIPAVWNHPLAHERTAYPSEATLEMPLNLSPVSGYGPSIYPPRNIFANLTPAYTNQSNKRTRYHHDYNNRSANYITSQYSYPF